MIQVTKNMLAYMYFKVIYLFKWCIKVFYEKKHLQHKNGKQNMINFQNDTRSVNSKICITNLPITDLQKAEETAEPACVKKRRKKN